MSNLQIVKSSEKEKWDKIVKSFKGYDVCYLLNYALAFQLQGDGEPQLIYYDDGSTRAINVVMIRDISCSKRFIGVLNSNEWFDLSTPYGYGGFWVEGKNDAAIQKAYDEFCYDQGFICEFVRFHLFSAYQPNYTGICETYTHNVIRSLELPIEAIWKDFDHKVRKNVNRALQSDLSILIDPIGEGLNEFLKLYYNTMERTGAKENFYFTKDFFDTINQMDNNYTYFHVLYNKKVISTELVLYGIENCYSFLGGTDHEFFHLRPNDFLKYEIIKWAKDRGLKRFILGGGYGRDDGIFQYKKSFAPNGVYSFYVGKKIFHKDKYDKLLSIRKENFADEINENYFPEYRG